MPGLALALYSKQSSASEQMRGFGNGCQSFPSFELVVKFGALEQKGVETDVRVALCGNGTSNVWEMG